MAKFCSECGEPLLTPTSRFCSECGAEQVSAGSVSTRIDGSVNHSTIISSSRDVILDKGEAIECPDCFGSGIKHVNCPNCQGTGLTKELIPKEFLNDTQLNAMEKAGKHASTINENSAFKDKAIATVNFLVFLGVVVKADSDSKKYAENDRSYREVNCPVCEGKKQIPINHEENLKSTRIYDIPSCRKCRGAKKIYLSD